MNYEGLSRTHRKPNDPDLRERSWLSTQNLLQQTTKINIKQRASKWILKSSSRSCTSNNKNRNNCERLYLLNTNVNQNNPKEPLHLPHLQIHLHLDLINFVRNPGSFHLILKSWEKQAKRDITCPGEGRCWLQDFYFPLLWDPFSITRYRRWQETISESLKKNSTSQNHQQILLRLPHQLPPLNNKTRRNKRNSKR